MGSAITGEVLVPAKIENLDDLFGVDKGEFPAENVRRVEVSDALVDTGATGLLIPRALIAQLGLTPIRVRYARTITGQTA